jgi:acyl-CoA synthetase (AMP-forming)/AMP-acid ligase II
LHNHNSIGRVIDTCALHWGVKSGDVILMPSPVTHITGYAFGLEMPFRCGTRTLLMENWNAREAAQLIETHSVIGTVSATPFLQELTEVARTTATRLPSLRFFGCGGAPVPPGLIREANVLFAQSPAFRVFGCSELPMITLGWLGPDRAELAATTDGQIVDYEVRVVDDHGAEVTPGKEGELLARGPSMFLGYADPAQTREAITEDGWFRTGDLGMLAPNGAILVTGRKKDLIIRGGENISAKEIEDVLHRCPGILEVAVVAMPHARLGEGVCAFVVLVEGSQLDFAKITAFVAASGLANQKRPEHVEFVGSLPKTASGKVRKDQLRAAILSKMQAAI